MVVTLLTIVTAIQARVNAGITQRIVTPCSSPSMLSAALRPRWRVAFGHSRRLRAAQGRQLRDAGGT
jgi:hypothetical protein